MLENIFIDMLEISLTSAVVIGLILLVSKLAEKKFRKKWRYWIWLIIAVRLVIPFNIEFSEAPIHMEIPIHEMVITKEEEILPVAPQMPEELSSEAEPEVPPEAAITPETPAKPQEPAVSPAPEGTYENNEHIANPIPPTKAETYVISVPEAAAIIWLIGAAVVFGWNVTIYCRFIKRAEPWNREITDEEVIRVFNEIKIDLEVPDKVKIYENRLIKSPMMVGVFKPRVLLPAEKLKPEEYGYVLRHELTHYKRGDVRYKFILMLASAIHWFNPLIKIMCRNAESDIEITCDTSVVKTMESEERREYCNTILNIMRRGQNGQLLLSTSFYGGAEVLKKRFAAVLQPKVYRGTLLFMLAISVMIVTGGVVALSFEEVMAQEPAPVFETEEQIENGALNLVGDVYRNMNTAEENIYDMPLSRETEEFIKTLIADTHETASFGKKIDYKVSVVRFDEKAKGYYEENALFFQVIERYYYKSLYEKYGADEEHRTTVSNIAKVVFDRETGLCTDFVIYGIDWLPEEYYVEDPFLKMEEAPEEEPITYPDHAEPDENGFFPAVSFFEWHSYVSNNQGAPDTRIPEEEISSMLADEKCLALLEELFPDIENWKIVYEQNSYIFTRDAFDLYTNSVRDRYMPVRFAVIQTEEAKKFDTVFISIYEDYSYEWIDGEMAKPYISVSVGGYATGWADQLRLDEIEEWNRFPTAGKYEKSVVLWNVSGERKLLVDDGNHSVCDLTAMISSSINVIEARNITSIAKPDKYLVTFNDANRGDVIILTQEGKYYSYHYYDSDSGNITRMKHLLGDSDIKENMWFLTDTVMVVYSRNNLWMYDVSSGTEAVFIASIGGTGNSVSEGVIEIEHTPRNDRRNEERNAFMYKDYNTGEWWVCLFELDGSIINNFSTGFDMKGTMASFTYAGGLAYFSYYPEGGTIDDIVTYALETRPDRERILQANAW